VNAAKQVLFVDDDASIRLIASLALERVGGFRVALARHGREALEMVAKGRPDVVLLDVMMPFLDGPATLAALRRRYSADHLPVVFLTAALQSEQLAQLHRLDAQGVLGKPFDPMRLAADLRLLLGWEPT
jgi:two-component system, OmpR family, response regulator